MTLPSIIPVRPSYTEREYADFVELFLNAKRTLCPDWTLEDPKDPACAVGLFLCVALDQMAYYQDAIAGEAFIDSAQDIRNVQALLSLIGYEMSGPSPATATVQLVRSSVLTETVIVPERFAVSTTAGNDREAIRFEAVASVPWLAGNNSVDVAVKATTLTTDSFTGDGKADLVCALTTTPVDKSTVTVWIDGNMWTETDTLLTEEATAQVFITRYRTNWGVDVIFGNGTNGAIPASGAEINIQYEVGGGANTNVAAATINTVIDSLYYSNGTRVTGVACTNEQAASGGTDGETVEHARAYGPATNKTRDRLIETDDFETLVPLYNDTTYGMVSAARAVPDETFGGGWCVYVLNDPVGTSDVPQVVQHGQLAALYDWMVQRKSLDKHIAVQSAGCPIKQCRMTVTYRRNHNPQVVKANVLAALRAAFRPSKWGIGNNIGNGAIGSVVQSVYGVVDCTVTTTPYASEPAVISVEEWEFPFVQWILDMELES